MCFVNWILCAIKLHDKYYFTKKKNSSIFPWKNILGLNNLAEGRTEVLNLYTTAMAFPRP